MTDLSTPSARLALVAPIAAKYGLRPEIVAAVCEQESDWNPWAVRAEPAFKARYVDKFNLSPTETWSRSMSFGLMQIMGQTARELGFQGTFLTELCDAETGVEYGCRKLKRCFDVHPEPERALLLYNGGGNSFYPAQVLARVAKYESTTETQSHGGTTS